MAKPTNPFPPITIPPRQRKSTGPPSQKAALASIAKQYPVVGQWIRSGLVENAAKAWGADPVEVAAVLAWEGGHADATPNAAGAVGPAQIVDRAVNKQLNPNAYASFVAQYGADITPQKAADPVFSIEYLAWRLAGSRNQYGSLDDWYSHNYNPGFTGDARGQGPQAVYKTSGVPTYQATIPQTPTQQAAGTATSQQARQGIEYPWAVVGKNGGLSFVRSVAPPKGTVHDALGLPVTEQTWATTQNALDNVYMPWTGVRATPTQVAAYIRNPISNYQLQQNLSDPKQNPRIFKSPIWLTHAPEYEAVYKSIYGNDAVPPRRTTLYAVVHNLSETGYQQFLRNQPGYEQSEEFQANKATFRTGYESIYGEPDAAGEQKIAEAARQGMNADQWMQYLRSQPEYTASGEFQRNIYDLFSRMGLTPAPPGQTVAPTALQAPTTAAAVPTIPTPPAAAPATPGP